MYLVFLKKSNSFTKLIMKTALIPCSTPTHPAAAALNSFSCFFRYLPLYFYFLKDFTYLFEREDTQAGRVAEGEKLGGSSTWSLIPGPQDHDLNWKQTLNQLSHPDASTSIFLNNILMLLFLDFCWLSPMEDEGLVLLSYPPSTPQYCYNFWLLFIVYIILTI